MEKTKKISTRNRSKRTNIHPVKNLHIREFLNLNGHGEMAAIQVDFDKYGTDLMISDCQRIIKIHSGHIFDYERGDMLETYKRSIENTLNSIYKYSVVAETASALKNHIIAEILRCRADAATIFCQDKNTDCESYKNIEEAEAYLISLGYKKVERGIPNQDYLISAFFKNGKKSTNGAIILRNSAFSEKPILCLMNKDIKAGILF